jgi:hypothetical protein
MFTIPNSARIHVINLFCFLLIIVLLSCRDQHLELSVDNEKVTAEEYLEFCLIEKRGFSKHIKEYNDSRQVIKDSFPIRTCFAFPPPTSDSEQWNILDTLREDQLSPEFLKAGKQFMDYIEKTAVSRPGPKNTGRLFSSLTMQYVEAMIKKNTCIEQTYMYVVNRSNEKAIEEAMGEMNRKLATFREVLPASVEVFNAAMQEYQIATTAIFLKSCMNTDKHPEYQMKLQDMIDRLVTDIYEENNRTSKEKCERILKSCFSTVEEKIKTGKYAAPGGFKKLKAALKHARKEYNNILKRGEFGPKAAVLLDYHQQKVQNS